MQALRLLVYALFCFLGSNRSEKCLKELPEIIAKKHFKLQGSATPLLPLRLSYGHHASQQISTYILHIIAEEVLGYEDVELVDRRQGERYEEKLAMLSGCSSASDCHDNRQEVPEVFIDTEVWVPYEFRLVPKWSSDKNLIDAGEITYYGRYGLYIPKQFVESLCDSSHIIADNWRTLAQHRIDSKFIYNVTEMQQMCRRLGDCSESLSHFEGCPAIPEEETSHCVVLLAGFQDQQIESIVKQQISNLNLGVIPLWFGSKLIELVREKLKTPQKPFLVLTWEPNTLTSTDQLTRVFLPNCRPDVSFIESNERINCDFPPMRLKKFAWAKIESGASEIHHVLKNLYLPRDQLNSMLQKHADIGGDLTSREIACDWLREQRDVWSSWLPPSELHDGKIPIYLGGMFPMSQHTGVVMSRPGILVGAEMALRRINQDPTLLTNYSLELITQDTQCQTSLVLNSYIQFLTGPHNRSLVGILGPACSLQAEIIAEVSPFYNTIVMGYSVEGLNLANREKYPLFFRTSPSYYEFKKAYASLFDALDWKQYATLTDINYASSTTTHTHEYLDDNGVKLVYSRVVSPQEINAGNVRRYSIRRYLRSIKRKRVRIIIANLFEGLARAVVCEAYKQDMTPQRGYVWFLPYWLRVNWWGTCSSTRSFDHVHVEVPCTPQQMREFVSGGYFSLSNSVYGKGGDHVIGGSTVDQWKRDYEGIINKTDFAASEYASFAYDAVWAYAVALDKLFRTYPSSLDTIRTNVTTLRLKDYLQQTNLNGASGQVEFKNGERFLPTLNILQHFPDTKVTVGQFVPVVDGTTACPKYGGCLHLNQSGIAWPGGSRPTDGRAEAGSLCAVEAFRLATGFSCDGALAVIYVITFGLLFVLVIVVIWIYIKRRYDKKYKHTRKRMEELGLVVHSPVLQLDDWEVPRENVVLNRKLGQGAFGTVFGGEAKGIRDQLEWVPVAVKTLKAGSTPEDKLEFLSEAETMKVFDHRNIVKLLGVSTKGEPAFAIMEQMIHGDLKNFLLARRQFVNQDSEEAEDISPSRLTTMAIDITSGLAYISSLNFVHRDLALRNCMVGSGHVVKLGDFGMTRAMYDSDYYRFSRKAMLPVRWMAPESLIDGVFTTKSDVWGLGVTLWELCTMGSFPYQGLSNVEVVSFVKERNTMETPPGASEHFCELLKSCWQVDPSLRPNPDNVKELLTAHSDMLKPCINLPIASVSTNDCDDLPGDNITIAPKMPLIRKFSQNRRSKSPKSQRGRKISRMTDDKLNKILGGSTSSKGPSSGESKSRASSTSRTEQYV